MTFGIYDTTQSNWLLCQFGEEQHDSAVTFCNAMNFQHNKKLGRLKKLKKGQQPAELVKRYEVRAKED